VTSSWFFSLQLSQDARSNKHQVSGNCKSKHQITLCGELSLEEAVDLS